MLTATLPGSAAGRSRLLRGGPRGLDELRYPLVAALQPVTVHRLELGGREGMRRLAIEERFHPRFQARELLYMAELLDPVEEVVALQERCVSGVDQRIFGAVEEGSAALLFERLFEPLERHRDLCGRLVVI